MRRSSRKGGMAAIGLFICLLGTLSGCSIREPETEIEKVSLGKGSEDDTAENGETIELKWLLPNDIESVSQHEDLLNQKLKEDGYPFTVKLCFLDYLEDLGKIGEAVNRGEYDLFYTGYGNEADPCKAYHAFGEGVCLDLTGLYRAVFFSTKVGTMA